jgi:hypothetical protein
VNDKLKGIWQEALLLSQYLSGGNEKKHKTIQSEQQVPIPEFKPESPEYDTEALATPQLQVSDPFVRPYTRMYPKVSGLRR